MYNSFIRPTLEYADVLWEGCYQRDGEMLEMLQRRAARTVRRAIRGTPIANIYQELGWEPLERRRERHKLILFYKIVNNLTPTFLQDILPPTVDNRTRYPLRNNDNFTGFRTRTEMFKQSFFPSTSKLWNSLPPETRNAQSLSSFKRILHTDLPTTKPWFSVGDLRLSLIHARLRMGYSDLNSDLCNLHVQDNSACLCGHITENAEHYLLHCTLFRRQRISLEQYLTNNLPDNIPANIKLLLFGSDDLTPTENTDMFIAIQDFIGQIFRF